MLFWVNYLIIISPFSCEIVILTVIIQIDSTTFDRHDNIVLIVMADVRSTASFIKINMPEKTADIQVN